MALIAVVAAQNANIDTLNVGEKGRLFGVSLVVATARGGLFAVSFSSFVVLAVGGALGMVLLVLCLGATLMLLEFMRRYATSAILADALITGRLGDIATTGAVKVGGTLGTLAGGTTAGQLAGVAAIGLAVSGGTYLPQVSTRAGAVRADAVCGAGSALGCIEAAQFAREVLGPAGEPVEVEYLARACEIDLERDRPDPGYGLHRYSTCNGVARRIRTGTPFRDQSGGVDAALRFATPPCRAGDEASCGEIYLIGLCESGALRIRRGGSSLSCSDLAPEGIPANYGRAYDALTILCDVGYAEGCYRRMKIAHRRAAPESLRQRVIDESMCTADRSQLRIFEAHPHGWGWEVHALECLLEAEARLGETGSDAETDDDVEMDGDVEADSDVGRVFEFHAADAERVATTLSTANLAIAEVCPSDRAPEHQRRGWCADRESQLSFLWQILEARSGEE